MDLGGMGNECEQGALCEEKKRSMQIEPYSNIEKSEILSFVAI